VKAYRCLGVLATVFAAACSANPARTSAAVPLVIPEPPPRVAMDPVPSAEPPAEAVPVPASRPTASIPTTAPPRTAAAAPAPVPPATPATTQIIEPPRTPPPPDLLPAGPAGLTPTAGQVRDAMNRTKQKLDAIDRRRLNSGKRADYDSARRFLAQAEAAVKVNNLMLADSSAEKAETLADGLK
jgi:hypothetical protein